MEIMRTKDVDIRSTVGDGLLVPAVEEPEQSIEAFTKISERSYVWGNDFPQELRVEIRILVRKNLFDRKILMLLKKIVGMPSSWQA